MRKRQIAGLIVLTAGLVLGVCNMEGWFLFIPLSAVANCLPMALAALILLRSKKSDVMADVSAAVVGCLWGVLLGIALTAGFGKLLTSRAAHPYDEAAYGIIFAVSLLLVMIIWLMDFIRYEQKISFRRFLLQGFIAASLVLPTVVPAFHVMNFFEGILSQYVS